MSRDKNSLQDRPRPLLPSTTRMPRSLWQLCSASSTLPSAYTHLASLPPSEAQVNVHISGGSALRLVGYDNEQPTVGMIREMPPSEVCLRGRPLRPDPRGRPLRPTPKSSMPTALHPSRSSPHSNTSPETSSRAPPGFQNVTAPSCALCEPRHSSRGRNSLPD